MIITRPLAITAVALVALGACGSPAAVRTVDDEPDVARSATISDRLRDYCFGLDPVVPTDLPGLKLKYVDDQCEWVEPSTGRPELIVGLLASSGGETALDQTKNVLKRERGIAGATLPGIPAVFDPETRTLYVLEHGRLWYLQRVGPGRGVDDVDFLGNLGASLGAPRFSGL